MKPTGLDLLIVLLYPEPNLLLVEWNHVPNSTQGMLLDEVETGKNTVETVGIYKEE